MTNTQVPAVFSSIIGNYCESFTKEDSYVYTEPAAKAKNKKAAVKDKKAEAIDKAAAIAQDKLKWGLERKNMYITTCRSMFELDDPEAGIAGALRVQKKRASFLNHLKDIYPGKGRKWSKEDRTRVDALDAVSVLVDAHDKALRHAMSSHGMENGDVFVNINDILK